LKKPLENRNSTISKIGPIPKIMSTSLAVLGELSLLGIDFN